MIMHNHIMKILSIIVKWMNTIECMLLVLLSLKVLKSGLYTLEVDTIAQLYPVVYGTVAFTVTLYIITGYSYIVYSV